MLVAALGSWLSAEGPSPGLACCTLSTPWFAGSMGAAVAIIRLREALTNSTGEQQLLKLEVANHSLQTALGAGSLCLVLVALIVVLGAWRAKTHDRPVTHWLAVVPGLALLLPLLFSFSSAARILMGWDGANTASDVEVAAAILGLLVWSTIGLGVAGAFAGFSILGGVLLRMRRAD